MSLSANAGDIVCMYMDGANFVRNNLEAAEKRRKEQQLESVRRAGTTILTNALPRYDAQGRLIHRNAADLMGHPDVQAAFNAPEMKELRMHGVTELHFLSVLALWSA